MEALMGLLYGISSGATECLSNLSETMRLQEGEKLEEKCRQHVKGLVREIFRRIKNQEKSWVPPPLYKVDKYILSILERRFPCIDGFLDLIASRRDLLEQYHEAQRTWASLSRNTKEKREAKYLVEDLSREIKWRTKQVRGILLSLDQYEETAERILGDLFFQYVVESDRFE